MTLLAKLEYLNPAGSVKDRVALGMQRRMIVALLPDSGDRYMSMELFQ